MDTISVRIYKEDVYEEVAKVTAYTGAKLVDGDAGAPDRILATDSALSDLGRFWDLSVLATNERLKEMLVSGVTKLLLGDVVSAGRKEGYEAVLRVGRLFDKGLKSDVESALRNYFIASIVGRWFRLSNKGESAEYFEQGEVLLGVAERLLYSRKRPVRPTY